MDSLALENSLKAEMKHLESSICELEATNQVCIRSSRDFNFNILILIILFMLKSKLQILNNECCIFYASSASEL